MQLDKIIEAVNEKRAWAASILKDSTLTIFERAEMLRDIPEYCLPIADYCTFEGGWHIYLERYEVFNGVETLNNGYYIGLNEDIEGIFNEGYAGFRYYW